jgi:hypothetical protein
MSVDQQDPALLDIVHRQEALCFLSRLLPLTPRNDPENRRENGEYGKHSERAERPSAPLSVPILNLASGRLHERWKLSSVPQLTSRVALHPLHGFGELHGVEQAGRAPAALDPLASFRFQSPSSLFVRSPQVDPLSERRPSRDERLVRQVRKRAAIGFGAIDRDQAILDELLLHPRELGVIVRG